MKKAELEAAMKKGQIVMLGTYWSGSIETIHMRSKEPGGPKRDAHVTRETVMRDEGAVTVEKFLPDGSDPLAWKPSAKRGQEVVVRIEGLEKQMGNTKIRGIIEPLD